MTDVEYANLFNQAKNALARRDFPRLRELCSAMLARRRDEPNALLLMVEWAKGTWHLDEAIGHLSRVVRNHPNDPRLRVSLGQLYLQTETSAKAIAQFDRALKLEPGLPTAAAGKATIYIRQNKHDRAKRVLKSHVSSRDIVPQVAWLWLHLLIRENRFDEAIDAGRRVVEAHEEPSMELRGTWFQLARAYERTGEHEQAFRAAERGNAILAIPFDTDQFGRFIDSFIEVFSPERLAAVPRPAEPSEKPMFIVGMPRCGSTLTDRIIHSHPSAHGIGEHISLFRLTQELAERIESDQPYPQCATDLDEEDVETQAAAYLDEITRLAPRAERICNKDLGNYLNLGLVNVLMPRARVIHCRRAPLDTCLSCYMEPLLPAAVPYASDLRTLGLYYREYMRLMDYWQEVLDLERLEIDYEDLVSDQEPVTRRIIEFCGLPWDDACLSFHETRRSERTLSLEQVRKKMYTTSVSRADRFGALLDPLREALGEE